MPLAADAADRFRPAQPGNTLFVPLESAFRRHFAANTTRLSRRALFGRWGTTLKDYVEYTVVPGASVRAPAASCAPSGVTRARLRVAPASRRACALHVCLARGC